MLLVDSVPGCWCGAERTLLTRRFWDSDESYGHPVFGRMSVTGGRAALKQRLDSEGTCRMATYRRVFSDEKWGVARSQGHFNGQGMFLTIRASRVSSWRESRSAQLRNNFMTYALQTVPRLERYLSLIVPKLFFTCLLYVHDCLPLV
jgi:hypothetical protein